MGVEVDALGERFAADSPAEAPSAVASEAGITEAALTPMEAVSGGPSSTLEWAAGVTRIIRVIRITALTDTIRITTATILTDMAVRHIPRRR